MARSRNIKPGFSKNEDLAECCMESRLCFALLPTLADREGRLEDRPKRIKGELFPFDTLDVEPLLRELDQRGLIFRYAVDGLALIQIVAFLKHQNPHHREPPSTLPSPQSLRLDSDGKWVKPEAKQASHPPNASGKPQAGPGLDPPRSDLEGWSSLPVEGGSSRVDSGIPDSRDLIPESSVAVATTPSAPKTGVASSEAAPMTAKDRVWLLGPPLVGDKGRSALGKLAKTYGEEMLAQVLADATLEKPINPLPWITAALMSRKATTPPKANGNHAPQSTLDLLNRDAHPPWVTEAGFEDIFAAESAGCGPGNFRNFRDGRRTA
jgi:hypothetical protein